MVLVVIFHCSALLPFAGHQEGGQPREAVDQQELSWRRPSSRSTHFPSTRILASEPVRQLGFSGENPKRDPQVMSGAFENFPTAFSWDLACRLVLKKSSSHGTGRQSRCGWSVVASPSVRILAVPSRGWWFW